MAFRETARRLLDHHRVVELGASVREAAAQRARVERELEAVERRVPWYQRVVFFHDTVDEARAKELRGQLEAADAQLASARAARDAAARECGGACPPIDVVLRLETIIAELLADPRIARTADTIDAPADALEALAADVLARWTPGVDPGALLDRLSDDAARAQAARTALGRPLRDDTLAWAPMGADELFTRAAHEIESEGVLRAARERLAGAQLQRDAIASALAHAQEQVGWWDRVVPGASETEQARDARARALTEQERHLVSAIEEAHHAVVRGLSRHPVLWVALACRGAAAALRAVLPRDEPALDATTGAPIAIRSAYGRAVVLACLFEARAACDAAFDGLCGLVAPRASAPERSPDADRGPYRLQGFVARKAPAPTKGATEEARQFFVRLEDRGLRQELAWAVSHATMLGLLTLSRDRVRERIGWLDRAVFWSDTGEEVVEDGLEERSGWHEGLIRVRAAQALALVEGASNEHPLLALGRDLSAAHRGAQQIGTAGGSSSSPRSCPVYHRQPVLDALDRATEGLCARFGATADRAWLVKTICDHLRRAGAHPIRLPEEPPSTPADVALLLAARLQGTAFLESVETLSWAEPAASNARAEANAAARAVSMWDKINIFTDSPEEVRREELKQAADAKHQLVVSKRVAMHGLYRDALRAHPPSLLVEQALYVRERFAQISATSERRTRTYRSGKRTRRVTYYVCVLHGLTPARSGLHAWARGLVELLGPLPCAGDLLDEWVASELR